VRRVGIVGLFVMLYVFLAGMGGLGGPALVKAPEPATNYAATVTDQSDIATSLEKFSFEGRTFLSGKLGDAHISISFDKIGSIRFVLQEKMLTAEVELKDGKTIPVVMDRGTDCYGKLEYGDFKIAVEHIKSITIHGPVSQKTDGK
jgi:hypothetical protein